MNNKTREKVNKEAKRLTSVGANIKANKTEYAKQFGRLSRDGRVSSQSPTAANVNPPQVDMGNPF